MNYLFELFINSKLVRYKKIISLIFLNCLSTLFFAQGNRYNEIIPDAFDLVESYTIVSTSTYAFPKGMTIEDLHELDRFKLFPKKEVKHVTKTLDKLGNYVETIVIERPDYIEDWIIYPEMIVIDEYGIKQYDIRGDLVSDKKISEHNHSIFIEKKQDIKKKGKFMDVNFDKLTGTEKAEIMKQNGKVKSLSFYAEEIDLDSIVKRNIPEKLVKQFVTLDKEKKLLNSQSYKFSINKEGDYYVDQMTDYSLASYKNKSLDDIEIKESVVEKTSKYNIHKSEKYKRVKLRATNPESNMWKIENNPINGDFLGLRYMGEADFVSNVELKVIDMSGRIVKNETLEEIYKLATINISNIPSGVFLLSIKEGETENLPIKFVKL